MDAMAPDPSPAFHGGEGRIGGQCSVFGLASRGGESAGVSAEGGWRHPLPPRCGRFKVVWPPFPLRVQTSEPTKDSIEIKLPAGISILVAVWAVEPISAIRE